MMRSWSSNYTTPNPMRLVVAAIFLVVQSLMISIHSSPVAAQGLSMDYYQTTCPQAEAIARRSLQRSVLKDPTAPASLLRLAFHDCQVQRCDASILLASNPSAGIRSELMSGGNLGIRRLDIIAEVKKDLEAACPNTVSCADIVAMVGRDAVSITGGPSIAIPFGRKDARNASVLDADRELPPASSSVDMLLGVFKSYGMNVAESVAILGAYNVGFVYHVQVIYSLWCVPLDAPKGAHTIGIGHCANVVSRLYPKRDPTLPLSFYMELRMLCPATPPRPSKVFQNLTGIVPTDLTNLWFDNQYFRDVQDGRGLFKVDANLVSDPRTRRVVQQFASSEEKFFTVFASAYFKMVTAKVLTGDSGNVRVDCTRPGEATTSVIN